MVPFLVTLILLGAMFIWFQTQREKAILHDSLNKVASTTEKLIQFEIKSDIENMNMALISITSNEKLINKLIKEDRQGLVQDYEKLFGQLRSLSKITHFYFHRTDRTNLVRLHELDHSDDTINRTSLIQAQKTKAPTSGVEQGPTGASVLRVVFPVHSDKKIVGYVELGKEFQDILLNVEGIAGIKSFILVEKSKVDKKRWLNRNNKLDFKAPWDFYPHHAVMGSSIYEIPPELKTLKIIPDAQAPYFDDIILVEDGKSNYRTLVMPLYLNGKEKLADLILLSSVGQLYESFNKNIYLIALTAVVIILLLTIYFFFLLGKVENLVSNQQVTLINISKMAALGEMAGGIAHEINNPLTIIASTNLYLKKLVIKGNFDTEKVLKLLDQVDKTVIRMAKIIQGLRVVSRDISDEPFIEVSLRDLMNDVIGLCSEKFKSHEVDFIVNLNKSVYDKIVPCRRVQLSQVFINLLGNAFDAIENLPERWIKIDSRIQGRFIEFRVSDSGHGIPTDVQAKIFQPFFSTKPIGKGTGLGLSLSHSIIKDHSGDISIDNQCKHTCFIIRIPLNKDMPSS